MTRRIGRIAAVVVLLSASSLGAEERIAFLGQTGGYWQVWTMAADGADPRQVTDSQYEKSRVVWFPDGERLLVVSLEGRLFEVDVQSGKEKPLSTPLQAIHDAAPAPRGDQLAVAAITGDSRDTHDIWLVGLDGKGERRLVSMPWLQHEPRWSADGEWVYFVSGDGQQDHDVWRVHVRDGSTEQLTVGTRYHFEIDVAPSGAIAFSSNRTGDYELYARGPASSELTRWTESRGMDGHASWSPDGKSLVFHSTRGGGLNVWRQDGPRDAARQLTRFEGGARDPEWWRAPQ